VSSNPTAGLSAVYVKDAATLNNVPVLGNLDTAGNWIQAIRLVLGHVGQDGITVDDVDGFRLPVDSPNLLAALTGTLKAADASPPFRSLGPGRNVTVGVAGTKLADANTARTRLFVQHKGDPFIAQSLAHRVCLRWIDTADASAVDVADGEALDPSAVFDEYVKPTLQMWAYLDPSAAGGATETVFVRELGT
jgi:hypothetical protein